MSETRAFRLLKEKLLKTGRRLERVENVCTAGWPDVNGCFEGVEFWIEVKEPTEPKRATTPLFGSNHKLTIEQRNWILNQLNSGGLAYVYIDTGKNRILLSGKLADQINSMTVVQLIDKALWHSKVPVKKEKWERIADVIRTRTL